MQQSKFQIILFQDSRNNCPIESYLHVLKKESTVDKNCRIKYYKIIAYLNMLKLYGSSLGMPYVKHIKGPLWELRPLKDRIIYAHIEKDQIVLLHLFKKTTRKTPQKEMEQAERNLSYFYQHGGKYEDDEEYEDLG